LINVITSGLALSDSHQRASLEVDFSPTVDCATGTNARYLTKSYSFVVPIYNDEYLAEEFCQNFDVVFRNFLKVDSIANRVELIFVDDGSPICTGRLKAISENFPFVRSVRLSRNFGHHIALSCGYALASGDVIGTLNVDMQDPPDQLPLLIKSLIDEDLDIVIGVRRSRQDSFHKKLTSRLFIAVLNSLTNDSMPLDFACCRVMSRRFVSAYNQFTEKSRFLPGLERWLGFRRGFVTVEHRERKQGKSAYNYAKRVAMAINSIISFSDAPLRLAAYAGFVVAGFGLVLVVCIIIQKFFVLDILPGYTSLVALILVFCGSQLGFTGILGIYLGRVLVEVQNRPLYVIESKHNFGDS
jgi:dolichol-phosphate mannosyltransferase